MFNRNRNNGMKEVPANYDDSSAQFMLTSIFNQFPPSVVISIYNSTGKSFEQTLDLLLDKQNTEGIRPKEVKLPKIETRVRISSTPPVKPGTFRFQALGKNFDFEGVVKWKTFNLKSEKHLLLLKDKDDPITFDNLIEQSLEANDPVIQMPCASKKLPCNFLRSTIINCLTVKAECPTCKTAYPLVGKQPSGNVTITIQPDSSCEGYFGDPTIVLCFGFPSGKQGKNHPHPGRSYSGTNRVAYLPDTADGRKAARLLLQAFRQGEVFTIGKSLTNGADDQITYGTIHLKTQRGGGASSHGWPDNTYFDRLRSECAAKMIYTDEWNTELARNRKLNHKRFF
eukprot:snap_masked-scaffold_21-processed-gene-1.29-mRNA-1 protein AED:0.04 eAED:0.04 QI:0/-1/0/1/-1/1/1/0/339